MTALTSIFRSRWLLRITVAAGILGIPIASTVAFQGTPPGTTYKAVVDQYCVNCHNEKARVAELVLSTADPTNVGKDPALWERVLGKLRTQSMPPAGMKRPDAAVYQGFSSYLVDELGRMAFNSPNPGRPALHRLNRAEYTNAVRDLLALEVDGQSLLPADDSGYGFDNIGDVLSVSPMLLERYISAARQISRLVVGDPAIRPAITTYDVPKSMLQDDRRSEDLPFLSRGGIAIRHNFPLDGDYVIRIRLQRNSGGSIIGLGEPHQLDVRLDGARIQVFTIGGASNVIPEEIESSLGVRFSTNAGTHLIGVAFADERSVPEGMLKLPLVKLQIYDRGPTKGDPGVDSITVGGPYNAKGAVESASRNKMFQCRPLSDEAEESCAQTILSSLARRAYRRPVTDNDRKSLLNFFRAGRSQGNFETGIEMALQGMLVNPNFLFRVERDPANVAPDTPYRINDLELASRLSFFLWSSIPDTDLLDLAEKGSLKDPAVLDQQVWRLLNDSRAKALVDNFAGQWLQLRAIRSVSPDEDTFLDFDESLREAFYKEVELFFESTLREDRSVLDLLSADYTFVNERLARHYGIPKVYGSHFRRVKLNDEARWGLLGKGGILTVTSVPNRTSPTVRGKWVLENILGTPPPPPPPNVPALEENQVAQRLPMRQRMEQHRANPACASCHARMDPLGFALDNFDAIGRFRTTETESRIPIDVTGVLPDGTKFRGPVELRRILLRHPEQFAEVLTERLLTYALGRGVEPYDMPVIRKIVMEAAPQNYTWSSIIQGITRSVPFQLRMSAERTGATEPR